MYDGMVPADAIQAASNAWRREAYPDTYTLELQTLGVAEEVGELSHAVLKHIQGIRGYDLTKTRAEAGDAMGDAMIYMCGVAQLLNLNLLDEFERAWDHVRSRNIVQGSDPGQAEY